MRCNPLRWLWGLPLILALSWITQLGEHQRIEADLKKRAEAALASAGYDWASVVFRGRDGVLVGKATDDSEPDAAASIARRVWGVRTLDQQAELIEKADRYVWSATSRDGQLKLAGFVPSEATRKTILGVAKAQFPKADVVDNMKVARGAPAKDPWLGGISFGLRQLAGLKRGAVDMNGLEFSIAGEAADFAAYRGIKTALNREVRDIKDVKLVSDKVTPPVVSPFTWSAKQAGSQLVLSGHVPSDKQREDLFAHAKKAFPRLAIVDRMETADGAPDGWLKAAMTSVDQLAQLKDGAAEMSALNLALSGQAVDEAAAGEIRKAWRGGVPTAYKLSDAIKYPKPEIAVVSPFVTTIDAGAASVDVTGHVPTEAARAALIDAVKARLPGRTVNDRLKVGGGAPEGWQSCVLAAVNSIGKLGAGRASLSDRRLELIGQTENEAMIDAVPAELRQAAGRNCDVDARLTLLTKAAPPPAAPPAPAGPTPQQQAEAEAKRKAEEEQRRRAAEADAARKAAEEAEAQKRREAAALEEKRRSEANACQTAMRTVASEGIIQFQRASFDLDSRSLPTLNQLAKAANACPNFRIEIEGHTDAEGTPERNARLSQRRAEAVVAYLAKVGVASSRMTAVGYGETRPVAPNDTAQNRAKNRRIEFHVKAE